MWYVYVLRSKKDNQFYIGMTNNLKERFRSHNLGKVTATQFRYPFEIVYYEAHHNKLDAAAREQFLKTGWGRNWIKKTLFQFLNPKS